MINNDPVYRAGYEHAIFDLKHIFEQAMIFNPKMDIITLIEDWEKITAACQKKLFNKQDH